MSAYIVLKNIRVNRLNMLQSPYLYSPAPVFSSVCAGHKLGCVLGCNVDGVGIVHHKASPLIERIPQLPEKGGKGYMASRPVQFHGTPSGSEEKKAPKAPNALSLQPTVTAHLEISLVFKVSGSMPSLEDIKDATRTLRISGGVIADLRKSQICAEDTLANALDKTNNGFWIEDAMDVVSQRLEDGHDPVSAVFLRGEKNWLVPANLGFCAISEFKYRKGGRTLIGDDGTCVKVKNALADNMVGLVRYRPFVEIKGKMSAGDSVGLWHFDFIDDSFYVVKQ